MPGTCAFIVFKEIGLKDRMHSNRYYMGLDVRKPDFGVCQQQRRRPIFTQSDQSLCCSLIGKKNIYTCLMQNFILTSLCSWPDWLESYSETRKTGFLRDGLATFLTRRPCLDVKCMEFNHRPCRPWIRTKLTRLFTVRIGILWKEIIDTVYITRYGQIFGILELITYFCYIYHLILLFV